MPDGKGFENVLTGLAAGLPVVGAFGSAALQQKYALKNWERVNAYNTPKAQIERLKEAGLPLATMFGGQGGSTSSDISTPNVDPSLGTAEGIQRGTQLAFQKRQMALLDQQIRSATYDADMKENERDFMLSTTADSSDGKNIPDFEPQFGDTNQVQGLRRERAIKELDRIGKDIGNALQRINLDNSPEQIRAQIDHALTQIALGQLQIKRDSNYYEMLNQVSSDIMKGDAGFAGMIKFIKTWLYKFLLR